VGPDKYVKTIEKKHFRQGGEVKKQLEWNDDKQSK
jgi:hypothetical protein